MGLSRQGAVVLLRVPHPQTAASRRAVQPTELPVAFGSAPALPEHALRPVRVPDSRGAPASGASLAGVQEPSGQGVVWVAHVHVIQRHVHPDVLPCHHELPLETAPLFLLRLRLPLPLLLLPRQPASLHASPLRRCSLRPPAAPPPAPPPPGRCAPGSAPEAGPPPAPLPDEGSPLPPPPPPPSPPPGGSSPAPSSSATSPPNPARRNQSLHSRLSHMHTKSAAYVSRSFATRSAKRFSLKSSSQAPPRRSANASGQTP